ncbi:MAG: hypothetical protein Q8L27_04420 [archaeon]|nr:hypothetical protein [archaeon]
MKKTKAIVLFSGGLDSRLVVKLLQEQNLEVELIYFKLPFGCGCCNNSECNFNFSQKNLSKLTIFDCTKSKLFKEYLNVIKNPEFGRGTGMNPCIDCKIFMFKKAKEYADKNKIKIIATGEVLGERPMSQTAGSLNRIDKKLGFEILRPLSAKLLKETQVEKDNLVDRAKFLNIQGRQRKKQFELAKKFNINFPTPGGGCLLCEKVYTGRLIDFFKTEKNITPEKLSTLSNFRHFRSKSGAKILLGRNHEENLLLESLNKHLKWNITSAKSDSPGPTALYQDKHDKILVDSLIKAYSSKDLALRNKFDEIRI